uniref:Aspartate aminotransferase, mitochondrial n=1 Tax=Myxobolus squamalis TaxID=59785 RepID=A0A6B2G4P8_MYXSQ
MSYNEPSRPLSNITSKEKKDFSEKTVKTLLLIEETINEDQIFWSYWRFLGCKNTPKVGLTIGVYRDQNGQSYVLDVVKKVEQEIANEPHPNKDYLKMSGLESFVTGALKLLFGADCDDIQTGLVN